MISPFYRHKALYELLIRLLYRSNYDNKYSSIAKLVPKGSSVTELCCGPAILYKKYLYNHVNSYYGVDVNKGFISELRKLGGNGEVADLRNLEYDIPKAEVLLIQSSLYHFIPDNGAIDLLRRMVSASSGIVIISEPILNLTNGSSPFLSWLSKVLGDPGTGPGHENRFDEQSLDLLFEQLGEFVIDNFKVADGKEKVYILKGKAK